MLALTARRGGLLATVLAMAAARVAAAAPCGYPDLVDTAPPSAADGVPTDATLSARYVETADYLGEEVVLERENGDARPLSAVFDGAQGLLSVKPPEPLDPGAKYTVRWPGLRGRNSADRGLGRNVSFTTGEGPDRADPTFEGLTGIEWDSDRSLDNCADGISERYVFDLGLGAAGDDGGTASLTLVVFQTEGPKIGAAPDPVLTVTLPATKRTVRVTRTTDKAVGHVCFAAVVRDLGGRTSGGSDRQVCVTTVAPPFFRGCSTGSGPCSGGLPVATLALALAVAVVRRRRRARGGGAVVLVALVALLLPGRLVRAEPAATAPPPAAPTADDEPTPRSAPPCTTIAWIGVLEATTAGVAPETAAAITAEVVRQAEAAGYRPIDAAAVRRATAELSALPPKASAESMAALARSLGAQRVVAAQVEATGGSGARLHVFVFGSDGGRWTMSRDTTASAAASVAADLVGAALPPPVPADCVTQGPMPAAPTRTTAAGGTDASVSKTAAPAPPARPLGTRLALRTDAAFGASRGSFTNVLGGARLDLRFSPTVAIGAYLGYANLKGKDGRAHDWLATVQIERRFTPVSGSALFLPLRFATGYLPRNGPVLRGSAGLGFPVAPGIEIAADLVAPTVWVTRRESLFSLDVALECSFALL